MESCEGREGIDSSGAPGKRSIKDTGKANDEERDEIDMTNSNGKGGSLVG